MRVLYLTYDGLTDPLGQSQILPYLERLAGPELEIDIISFEKPERWAGGRCPKAIELSDRLRGRGIGWYPLAYTKRPPIFSTLFDLWRLRRRVRTLHRQRRYEVVHCRSYVTSLVGLWARRRLGCAFLFDMRGFWADERVDGGIWNPRRWPYSWVYSFFKGKEREYLREADEIVSLTQRAADIIQEWKLKAGPLPITVIPCCVELEHFSPRNVDPSAARGWRQRLSIRDGDFVAVYLGSVGTWYLLDEMLQLFAELLERRPEALLLFVTPDPPALVQEAARRHGVPEDRIRITFARREELPSLLSLARLGLFFIKPVFSKTASSATKFGELLSMGIPVVTNSGVGDTDPILAKYPVGALLRGFDPENYRRALDEAERLLGALDPERVREAARAEFSLDGGVARYRAIYGRIRQARGSA